VTLTADNCRVAAVHDRSELKLWSIDDAFLDSLDFGEKLWGLEAVNPASFVCGWWRN
jgi:hypothetical protein